MHEEAIFLTVLAAEQEIASHDVSGRITDSQTTRLTSVISVCHSL